MSEPRFKKLKIPGAYSLKLKRNDDERGSFVETFRSSWSTDLNIEEGFVQDGISVSGKNVLRGMHYQIGSPKAHLVQLAEGCIIDVGLDMRMNSPRFGMAEAIELSFEDPTAVFWPAGVAHGFLALGSRNIVIYKSTGYRVAEDEAGVSWRDGSVIQFWPANISPIISRRDRELPFLSQIPNDSFPRA